MAARGSRWDVVRRALLRGPALLATVSMVAHLALRPATAEEKSAGGCELSDGEDRTVTRVVDAETIALDGGSEVRLIGALAPRAFDSAGDAADWPYADRARDSLQDILQGRNVRLAFAGRRTDRYGRLLAHVFVIRSDVEIWVQGELLKRGLARAYALEGSTACLAELIAHEDIARQQEIGIWADVAYAVRNADDIVSLLRRAGTFQLVEGKVFRVSEVRGSSYINFGEDWRQDFTVVLRPATRRAMSAAGLKLEDLVGYRIRARGWIERRGGPMIDLAHPAAIEVLTTSPAAQAEPIPRRRSRRPPAQP